MCSDGWDTRIYKTTVSTYAHLSPEDMGEMFERYQKERAR
jgi:integrase/recombinase XerD